MYAIIEEGGGQRKVMEGDTVLIDLVQEGQAKPGTTLTFDRVLLVSGEGVTLRLGMPYVAGASVTAEVLVPEFKGEKLYIQKFRRRKAFDKKTGHRQRYTQVKISSIKA
jgi:large subunit ribosomal protein L21